MRNNLTTRRSALGAAAARIAMVGLGARAIAAPALEANPAKAAAGEAPGTVDLLDIIPPDLRRVVTQGTHGPDVSGWVQAGLAALGERGGLLRVPAGRFRLGRTIILPRRVRIVGVGRATSIFEIAHNGDAFRSEAPINSFTPVNVGIAHVGIVCLDNRASNGAGFHDQGGTYVDLSQVNISGFKYGCLFNQSEIVTVDLCQLEYSRTSAIWLVNGADLTPAAQTTFTNRVTITRCQINQADGYGIIDDGGRVHSFRDNNFNGCRLGHLRIAGYGEYVIDGNYFEEAGGTPILISNQTASGRNVQRPNAVVVTGNLIIAKIGQPSIAFEGATAAIITGNTFVGEGTSSIHGLNTVESLVSTGNAVQNPAGLFEQTRAVRSQHSSELTIDRFERLRLGSVIAGERSVLRIDMPEARPGDMPLISFEPPLPLRAFMPVADVGAILVELENAGRAPTMPLNVLVRIRLLKA